MVQIQTLNTQYAFSVKPKRNSIKNKGLTTLDLRESIYNNAALSQKVGLYFKGIILKPSKTEVSKALKIANTRKKNNIVINKQEIDANTVQFTYTNVHYMESKLRGMHSNSETTVMMTFNNDEKAVEIVNDLDENLAPVAIFSAISESIKNGFGGNIIWKIKDLEMLEKAFELGFRSTDESLNKALETKDEEALRSFAYQVMFGEDPFEMLLHGDSALKLKNNIATNLKNDLEDLSSLNKLLRGEFVSVDLDDSFVLGNKDKTEFSISADGKGFVKNLSQTANNTKVNGEPVKPDAQVALKKYDTVRSENKLYMFNGEGLRLISKDAGLIEELFPEGLKNLKLKQGTVGDCYFLSALTSLSRHPEGQELIAGMIEKTSEGNYNVTFPGFPEEVIEVDLDDNVYLNIGVKTVNTGVKILEQAFGQLKRNLNYSEKVLPKEAKTDDWLKAGIGVDALYILTGGKKVWLDAEGNKSTIALKDTLDGFITQAKISGAKPDEAYDYLREFSENWNKYVITAGTCSVVAVKSLANGSELSLSPLHEYVVSKIDNDKKEIGLINPRNTAEEMVISYDDFLDNFDCFGGVKLPFQV